MNRAISWLAAILFLGCLVLGYYAARQKTEIIQLNLNWDAAKKEAQKQILDLQHQLTAAKEAQIRAEKQVIQPTQNVSAPAQAKSEDASAGGSANRDSTIIHIGDIIKDHPEYAALYAKQMRRNVDLNYGDGLNTLNLSPDQLSKLKDLLTERQMGSSDALQLATAAGLERGSPAWQEVMKQASEGVDQQITGLLGPNANAKLAQIQARNIIQYQVNHNYATDFADAGAPLSPEQTHRLVQTMADVDYAGQNFSTRPQGYDTPDPKTGLTPHDTRVLNAAAQVLSPAQIQILMTDQIESHRVDAIMRQYTKGGRTVIMEP